MKLYMHPVSTASRPVRLLIAEALCINAMPIAPSELLLACGERAMVPLRCLMEDESIPRAGRASTRGANPGLRDCQVLLRSHGARQACFGHCDTCARVPRRAIVASVLRRPICPQPSWLVENRGGRRKALQNR